MLGILCGLEQEAKIARKIPGAIVACAAARPGKARNLASELIDRGATRLMSFGVAGALMPNLKIGEVVVGERIVSETGRWVCDQQWLSRLQIKIPKVRTLPVYGSEKLIPSAGEKRAINLAFNCGIVDMESQCAAEVAEKHNIPLAVVRSVCDTAHMQVPPLVMETIKEDGSINIPRALVHLVTHPQEIPDLIHVMLGINAALGALKRNRAALA